MNELAQSVSRLSLYVEPSESQDLIQQLLMDKRSINTQRAYRRDLVMFFQEIASSEPTPALVAEFLMLPRASAIATVMKYKSGMIDRGLKEATVNRRLAAIKSLVRLGQKLGKCDWSLEQIESEKEMRYRDTTGVSQEAFKSILAVPDRTSLSGKRDYAILHLLWSNALRRGEVVSTSVSDFDRQNRTLLILGKGRGTQKESISLSKSTAEAIATWLDSIANSLELKSDSPLFIALDVSHFGHRLTGQAIYNLVAKSSSKAGISKRMSPHRCRHSAITAALDATNGDMRKVQKLSRHKKIETLMIYDDNRLDFQGEVTDVLSNLMD